MEERIPRIWQKGDFREIGVSPCGSLWVPFLRAIHQPKLVVSFLLEGTVRPRVEKPALPPSGAVCSW